MTTYSGYDGYVNLGAVAGATAVGELNHWTTTITNGINDVTVFGDIWADFKPGINTWTATMDGFFDCEDTGQAAALDAIQAGSQVEAYFYVDGSKYYYGLGYVTSITADVAVAGVATASIDMQGTANFRDSCA